MKFYERLFASQYDAFMTNLESSTFHPIRKALIADLKGDILELGSGTGANFEFYNEKANVIALEPSTFMLEKSKAKLPKSRQIAIHPIGVNDEQADSMFCENSLDYIICTLVLCTIPDQARALANFKKWLRPTGKLVVLEHIHAQNKPARVLYNLVNPVWKVVGSGCNLNRDTDRSIKEAGFKLESEHYFRKSINFYQAVFGVPGKV